MATKNKNKENIAKTLIVNLIFVFALILIFAAVDYYIHSLSEEYAVPGYYFRNKIIFGTIIGMITLWFSRKLPAFKKALTFSAVVAVLLQIRYYLEGYPKSFVFEFLFIHFAILIVVSYITFKFIKM